MIILVAGSKGGTCKTTLSVNIAIHYLSKSKTVALLDADPKPDSIDFFRVRKLNYPDKSQPLLKRSIGDIEFLISGLDKLNDITIVDVGGYDSDEMREALSVADIAIFPFAPTRLDINTAQKIDKRIRNMQYENSTLKGFSVIVKCPTHYLSKRSKAAIEKLKDFEHLRVISTNTNFRESWMYGTDEGLGIEELTDASAKAEFQLILQEIESNTNG